MAQFIVRPAIMELTGLKPGTPEFGSWGRSIFYVPAVAGGIFGLLGGYLTDRLGRRRVLTWSILLYAFSAFAAGFSTSIEMLLVLPLHDVRRRLRRVRGGRGLAGRAVPRPTPARERAGLHAGVFVVRRAAGGLACSAWPASYAEQLPAIAHARVGLVSWAAKSPTATPPGAIR